MISQESLEYLVGLGEEKAKLIETPAGTFTVLDLNRIKAPKADTLKVSTLTGLVDYIKSKLDMLPEKLLIQIKSHNEVRLYSPLNSDREREEFLKADAILPTNIQFNRFIDTEQFNIMLQSSFVDDGDKDILLKYTGLVKDEAVKSIGDDGISQQVTVKTGVASVGQAIVPNPVTLAPYRTFPEIKQPLSKFIFRMKDGPCAALYEADGGSWRNEAMYRIKKYLEEQLEDVSNIEIIS